MKLFLLISVQACHLCLGRCEGGVCFCPPENPTCQLGKLARASFLQVNVRSSTVGMRHKDLGCHGHGIRVDGICWCENPFVGPDCSTRFDPSDPISTATSVVSSMPPDVHFLDIPIRSSVVNHPRNRRTSIAISSVDQFARGAMSPWNNRFSTLVPVLQQQELNAIIFYVVVSLGVVVIFFLALNLLGLGHKTELCDVLWNILRCGGFCTGKWTEKVCASNIKLSFARAVGIAPLDLLVSGLVLGDLGPLQLKTCDLTISMESPCTNGIGTGIRKCSTSDLITFPDVLPIQARNSCFSGDVVFQIKEFDARGSALLYELRIPSKKMVKYSKDGMRRKFILHRSKGSVTGEPWIVIQVAPAIEDWTSSHVEGDIHIGPCRGVEP